MERLSRQKVLTQYRHLVGNGCHFEVAELDNATCFFNLIYYDAFDGMCHHLDETWKTEWVLCAQVQEGFRYAVQCNSHRCARGLMDIAAKVTRGITYDAVRSGNETMCNLLFEVQPVRFCRYVESLFGERFLVDLMAELPNE